MYHIFAYISYTDKISSFIIIIISIIITIIIKLGGNFHLWNSFFLYMLHTSLSLYCKYVYVFICNVCIHFD